MSPKHPILAATLAAVALLVPAGVAPAATGDLDISFSRDGVAPIDFGGVDSRAVAAAVQPDGKIVLAGFSSADTAGNFAIARLLPDGQVDQGFGDLGRVPINFGGADRALAVAVAPDGKIVVAGSSKPSRAPVRSIAVARLEPDGDLDPSFAPGGKRLVSLGDDAVANAVAVRPDGRVLLAGTRTRGDDSNALLVGLTAAGATDPSFGFAGVREFTALGGPFDETGQDVALTPTGGAVLAADVATQPARTLVTRVTPNGSVDGSFATGGRALVDDFTVRALELGPAGEIVLAGRGRGEFAAARLTPGGQLDAAFGTGGIATAGVTDGPGVFEPVVATGLALTPSGGVFAAGTVNGLHQTPTVTAFDAAGSPDDGFAGDGVAKVGTFGNATGTSALLAGNRLILAGSLGTRDARDMAAIALVAEPPGVREPSGPAGDRGEPVIEDLRAAGRRGKARWLRVTLTLSEPATLKVTVTRRATGRRILTRTIAGRKGRNVLRLRGKRVVRGVYRVRVVAIDAAGNRSVALRVRCRVR